MRVEIFCESDSDRMQEKVNQWFSENPDVALDQIKQSESNCDGVSWLTISIFYQE